MFLKQYNDNGKVENGLLNLHLRIIGAPSASLLGEHGFPTITQAYLHQGIRRRLVGRKSRQLMGKIAMTIHNRVI